MKPPQKPTAPPDASASDPFAADDDELGGGLEFSRGGAETHSAGGPSAYSGGGVSLGDDDDPFADDVPAGALELDLPSSDARSARSIPAASAAPPQPQRGPAPPLSSGRLAVPTTSQPPRSGAGGPSSVSMRTAEPASLPPRSASAPERAPASKDPALVIARYPDPPSEIWRAPQYALKVVLRQLELRQDLASLRKRRSPDVALYERAIGLYDKRTFAIGLAINLVAITLATALFFLPVILRFTRED